MSESLTVDTASSNAAVNAVAQRDVTLSPVMTRATSYTTSPSPSPIPTIPRHIPGKVDHSSSLIAVAQASAARKKTRVRPVVTATATPEEAAAASELLENLVARTNAYLETTVLSQDINGGTAPVSKPKKKKRGRMSEREEDQMLLEEFDHDRNADGIVTHLTRQPATITGGEMRPYQLEGLNWLIRLYHGGISGILADEMGLGKTLQTISFLAYLKLYIKNSGPHMVIVPLSTLGNWVREFNRWCPSMRILKYHGNKEERKVMRDSGEILDTSQWDVMVTSYEMGIKEKALLNKIKWDFIVVDEAHRLKNENSLLSQVLRFFSSKSRLLITGTPLQNNLHELWALLNFLLPSIFSSSEEFDAMFKASENNANLQENMLSKLHAVLKPFMLRRLKQQVEGSLLPKKETLIYVGMSEMQMRLYKSVLLGDLDTLFGKTKEKTRLLNIVMQLRKAANHPYLFEGVEDRTLPPYGEHLVTVSGKVTVLDKLLARLKEQDSRVLIFSQMTRTVDILEDYCIYRQFKYCRIDGSTTQTDREAAMKVFNEPGSDKFIFLLSTRAGGLGINLATADIVILYDSDWNPQMDLQAQDRAHRIGQKKQVCVYRFVTEDTVEEKIIERAEIKLRLDAMVIQNGKMQQAKATNAMSKEDMTAMIRFGADRIMKARGGTLLDEDITAILSRGEQKTAELSQNLAKQVGGLMDLALDGEASLIASTEVNLDEEELRSSCELMDKINAIGKRERKQNNYDVNQYYKDALKHGGRSLLPRPIKIPKFFDYQFYNRARIEELSEKEWAFYEKYQWSEAPPAMKGITAEEESELKQLLSEGFPDWTRPQYHAFVAGVKRFGSQNIEKLHQLLPMKTLEQVTKYHAAFMKNIHTLPFGTHLAAKVARADARAARFGQMEQTLERCLSAYPTKHDTLEKLSIKYRPLQKGKGFTPLEDRIILYETAHIGYGDWKRLKRQVHQDPDFRFDYFLKSRTSAELNRRCDALLRLLGKDDGSSNTNSKRKSKYVDMTPDGFGSGFGNVKDRGLDREEREPKPKVYKSRAPKQPKLEKSASKKNTTSTSTPVSKTTTTTTTTVTTPSTNTTTTTIAQSIVSNTPAAAVTPTTPLTPSNPLSSYQQLSQYTLPNQNVRISQLSQLRTPTTYPTMYMSPMQMLGYGQMGYIQSNPLTSNHTIPMSSLSAYAQGGIMHAQAQSIHQVQQAAQQAAQQQQTPVVTVPAPVSTPSPSPSPSPPPAVSTPTLTATATAPTPAPILTSAPLHTSPSPSSSPTSSPSASPTSGEKRQKRPSAKALENAEYDALTPNSKKQKTTPTS